MIEGTFIRVEYNFRNKGYAIQIYGRKTAVSKALMFFNNIQSYNEGSQNHNKG